VKDRILEDPDLDPAPRSDVT